MASFSNSLRYDTVVSALVKKASPLVELALKSLLSADEQEAPK